MFGRKKDAPKRKGGGEALMAQMGIMPDMSSMDAMVYGDLENDAELEAELAALQGQDASPRPAKRMMSKENEKEGKHNPSQHGQAAIKLCFELSPDSCIVGTDAMRSLLHEVLHDCGLDTVKSDIEDLKKFVGYDQPKAPVTMDALNQMVDESMNEVNTDDDLSDTDDPELLSELNDLTDDGAAEPPPPPNIPTVESPKPNQRDMVSALQDRYQNYLMARDNAKAAGEATKARRMDRGVKTLEDLIRKAKTGRPVAEDDIPPLVVIASSNKNSPSTPEAPPLVQHPEPVQIYEPTVAPSAPPSESPASTPSREAMPGMEARLPSPSPQASMPSPQAVARGLSPKPTAAAQEQRPSQVVGTDNLQMLITRRDQYKMAAMRAKSGGYGEMTMKYLRTAKQFDRVINALESGQPIDLSKMPPPPPGFASSTPSPSESSVERSSMQATAATTPAGTPDEESLPDISEADAKKLFNAPTTATTNLEALQQRLDKYKSSADAAKQEGNGGKARRMGRIVKQYEDAVKSEKAGKPVNYDELPTPPGFPPFPTADAAAAPLPSNHLSPTAANAPGPAAGQRSPNTGHRSPGVRSVSPAAPGKPAAHKKPSQIQRQTSLMSRAEQQAVFLESRQKQFKMAALEAKKNGDIELAKQYIRMAKGFDQMIEAAHSGLPVDLSQVPKPPGSENEDFEFVEMPEGGENDAPVGDRDEMYKKLEQDLIQQIRTATVNGDHFTQLGDVSSASKFDKMCQNARKDLDSLKNAYKHGDPVPRFHYETRAFSLVQTNTDLGDNDLEIHIIRGINYGLPSDYSESDLDTYVKYEFPYPNDDPQKGATDTVKSTNCPEYNQKFKLQINRKARSFLRILKSKGIKFEVYYKRGFFKGDKLLGSASMKLLPLENKCTVHESYDMTEGRKTVGGKLEIKMRIRDPFVSKQVEEVKEKWLIIDRFDRNLPKEPQAQAQAAKPNATAQPVSMEVLKYEKQLLDRQITTLQGKLGRAEINALQHKSQLLAQRAQLQRQQLQKGGVEAMRMYANSIEQTKNGYLEEAQHLVKQGNREKAQIILNKKKLVEREVDAIRARIDK